MPYNENKSVEENQARALFEIADAIHELLYGLKHSRVEGMSIAEAIEVAGRNVGESIGQSIADAAIELAPAEE